jgi:hypothetical protein
VDDGAHPALFGGSWPTSPDPSDSRFHRGRPLRIRREHASRCSRRLKETSFYVTGEYVERYARLSHRWLISRMELKLYFSVPLTRGWADHKRHFLVSSGETIPDYGKLLPNPPI